MNDLSRRPQRLALVLLVLLLVCVGGVAFVSPDPATAASKCAALTKRVHLFLSTKRGVAVLTYNPARFAGLKKQGYLDKGVLFSASSKKAHLTAVRVMYDKRTHDRIYTVKKSEVAELKKHGYRAHGVGFYAYSSAGSCLDPLYRLHKGKVHRFALTATDRTALTKQGWIDDGTAFWVARPPGQPTPTPHPSRPPVPSPSSTPSPRTSPTPSPSPSQTVPPGDSVFTFAVMPDTQQEVLSADDPRFLDRTEWLVDHRNDLNLRFVTHTGDVVNWDTADHSQYQVVSTAMRPLEAAGIPYSMAIGNHDTQATGVGGSARDPSNTYRLQRDTTTFNAFFNAQRYGGDPVEFEPGKVDNLYVEYQAAEMTWMVLVLELWPRASVVAWAKQQVAAHPHDNVIVVTHDYVSAGGGLDQTAPYGDTTPQQLFDQLIKQYPNIKMVFSGHTGVAGRRVDTGVGGNKIYDYLGTFHSDSTDPMRLVTIDPQARTIHTWIYCPYTNQTMQSYTVTETGVSFVH